MNKQLYKLIQSTISIVLSVVLLTTFIYGWYVTNSKATITGATGATSNCDYVHFLDTATAKRHCLDGNIITYTYEIIGSKLILRKEEDESLGTTIEYSDNNHYFTISKILPSEYIDITIGYKMDKEMNNQRYTISLTDLTSDTFSIDNKSHFVSGAFKYKRISMVDKNDNVVNSFADESASFFSTYSIDKSDSEVRSVELGSYTWESEHEEIYYTFRIQEDFSEYYKLISSASESYGNLLSNRKFSIGNFSIVR